LHLGENPIRLDEGIGFQLNCAFFKYLNTDLRDNQGYMTSENLETLLFELFQLYSEDIENFLDQFNKIVEKFVTNEERLKLVLEFGSTLNNDGYHEFAISIWENAVRYSTIKISDNAAIEHYNNLGMANDVLGRNENAVDYYKIKCCRPLFEK
jgi:tetratricopeptide (TPR) repeat protein